VYRPLEECREGSILGGALPAEGESVEFWGASGEDKRKKKKGCAGLIQRVKDLTSEEGKA